MKVSVLFICAILIFLLELERTIATRPKPYDGPIQMSGGITEGTVPQRDRSGTHVHSTRKKHKKEASPGLLSCFCGPKKSSSRKGSSHNR